MGHLPAVNYTDALHALTVAGGDRKGWPDDVWTMIVWAAIGCGGLARRHAPRGHRRPAPARRRPRHLPDSAGPHHVRPAPPECVLAAAFAGLGRWATDRRDDTIRRFVAPAGSGRTPPPGTFGPRQLGRAVDLSHAAIAIIRDRGFNDDPDNLMA